MHDNYQQTSPAKRPSRPFNAAMMVHATGAIIDLSDPLRTNVKFSLGSEDMYADLTTLIWMVNDGRDETGVATTIVSAWEKVLGGKTGSSNMVTISPHGVMHLTLLGTPQGTEKPQRHLLM